MTPRCEECGHPLTEGEWSRCDAKCRHGGELLVRKQLGDEEWQSFDADRYHLSAGALATPADLGGEPHWISVQARGRARVEERDCPECDGDGHVERWSDDGFGVRTKLCPACSGRVRPLLCQACEGAET